MDNTFNQQLNQKLQESYQQLSSKAPDGLWERVQAQLPTAEVDQQLDDHLQASYEQLTVTAPLGLWEKIESTLPTIAIDEQLDDSLQASYEQLAVTAPLDLWEKIENTLPEAPLDQQIDQKLKEGFAQQTAKTAPTALWSVISDELGTTASLDQRLDEKIKASYKDDQTNVPYKVWAAVNRQLNIDRTWQKISTALDVPVVTFDWKLRTLQGIVLALLLLLWVRTCNKIPRLDQPDPIAVSPLAEQSISSTPINKAKTSTPWISGRNPQEERRQNKTTAAPHNLMEVVTLTKQAKTIKNATANVVSPANSVHKKTVARIEEQTSNALPAFVLTNGANKKLIESKKLPEASSEETNVPTARNGFPLLKETSKEATANLENGLAKEMLGSRSNNKSLAPKTLEALTVPPIILLPEELELANEPTWKSKSWTPKNRLTVGVFTAVNSTVLFNNETREGFDYNSLTINYFGLAANYGVWARYNWNEKGALMAEYSINADHRQAYGVYQKGQFSVKEYVFKYNRLSLAYEFNLWQDQRYSNNKVTAQLGAYVGAMRAAQLYYNGVLVNDNVGEYHEYDGGLKVALGHEIAIDHFVIGYGIRSDIGVANIFKGNKKLNKQQDRTNLIHLGGYIHLGYQF
ncbi:MAG: hypothetical protein ACRBFS_24505 [Aureispira sp.]